MRETGSVKSVEERVVDVLNVEISKAVQDPEIHAWIVQNIIAELIHRRLLRRYAEEEMTQ